jgi:hypothetical protein
MIRDLIVSTPRARALGGLERAALPVEVFDHPRWEAFQDEWVETHMAHERALRHRTPGRFWLRVLLAAAHPLIYTTFVSAGVLLWSVMLLADPQDLSAIGHQLIAVADGPDDLAGHPYIHVLAITMLSCVLLTGSLQLAIDVLRTGGLRVRVWSVLPLRDPAMDPLMAQWAIGYWARAAGASAKPQRSSVQA